MQITVLYTGESYSRPSEKRIIVVVVAGNNSAYPLGSELITPLGDFKIFNHKITLENDMKATVRGGEVKHIDFSKPQLLKNVNSGSIIMTTGSVDTEEGTVEGVLISACGSGEYMGQFSSWYMEQLTDFTGEITIKND